uniref:Ribosomal protein S1 n=2 Tax=Levilinea saccharolytica TaxID=229921 RepID=A0A0M8JPC4_9CHLR|nr:ribosomal protein S1 [Levilinea saccharolytica]
MDVSMNETNETAEVKLKTHFTGTVAKVSLAGALIDIGVGQPAVIHISQIEAPEGVTLHRVEDILQVGQQVDVWVRKVKDDHIELTMIKPLDLEWREIKKGMSVHGTVVRLEKFGAFVEIGAERPGLVHISEMAHGYVREPSDVVKEGDEIDAEVLEVNRRKKQIKLSMKALQPEPEPEPEPARPASQSRERFASASAAAAGAQTARRPKKARKQRDSENAEFNLNIEEPQPTESDPTALEYAFREAMERAKQKRQEKGRKGKNVTQEQMDILSRTLDGKARQD